MSAFGLENLASWKDFERLCIDLLSAEGFLVPSEAEPYVDTKGEDFAAIEEYRSHDPSRTIRVRWRVQCKHYAGSGRRLGREEVESALVSYECIRRPDEGLFLIVDTDYTEPAKEVVEAHARAHPDARVTLWNQRQLMTKLERHSHLLLRYGLSFPKFDYVSVFSTLEKVAPVRTLIISDQSAMAHNLATALRAVGFDITFLPFWNYGEPTRLQLAQETVLERPFRFVICLLGDSFGLPLPVALQETIERSYQSGASILLFPFLAWSMNRGLYHSFQKIVPVRLQDPTLNPYEVPLERVIGDYRRGDFRWMLSFDSFAEDKYVELDPRDGVAPFTNGITARFGLSHSFEYLTAVTGAQVVWADTTGNPVAVVKEFRPGRICYLNLCSHSCMTTVALSSPLEASVQASILFRNIIEWLLL
jgi:hypothetical protein